MPRWFNIAGPCFADEHFMIPPERRTGEALELIGQRRWFTLVSGRQTGKTTLVQWLARTLTARSDHLAIWVDLEDARDRPDPAVALRIAQLSGYLDALGLDEGWLVIFRNDPKLSWDERVFVRTETVGERRVHVVGC